MCISWHICGHQRPISSHTMKLKSVLYFHCRGSWDWTQLIRLVGTWHYWLSYLVGLGKVCLASSAPISSSLLPDVWGVRGVRWAVWVCSVLPDTVWYGVLLHYSWSLLGGSHELIWHLSCVACLGYFPQRQKTVCYSNRKRKNDTDD